MRINELSNHRAKRRFLWHYTNHKGSPIDKSPFVTGWWDGADGATMQGFKYISDKDRRALCYVLLYCKEKQFKPEMTIAFTDSEGQKGILFIDYELVEYPNGFKRNEFTFRKILWLEDLQEMLIRLNATGEPEPI
tara:strand:- start:884 stop:1288 length:405 start_codon:yes stop_codon:yes gene_type:complete